MIRLTNYLLCFALITNATVFNLANADDIRILMLGDSITSGLGLSREDSLPTQLQTALRQRGHPVTVINAGVSGDTTAGGVARLDWTLSDQPDAVIVALGGNDALRAVAPEVTKSNLDKILLTLKSLELPTMLVGMLAPANLGPEYGADFNKLFPQLAEKYEVLLYPFLLQGVALNDNLNQPDGIHPNQKGVAVIVAAMTPYVEKLLSSMQ